MRGASRASGGAKEAAPARSRTPRLDALYAGPLGMLLRLADPWDAWYGRLEAYAEEHGDALVPKAYETADGYALGKWVIRQRQARKSV